MSKTMEKGTENAIFLDGRDYTAADLYRLISLLVGNGVYTNELAPTATNEDMSITHGAGHAWISGVAYWNTTPFVLEIATADGSLNRYDSLMLRLNLSINEVYAVIVQGAYATAPTPPDCTRNAETFDLKICDIYVPAGCTKITQDQIIDTRLDSSVCGVPVFPVEHMDMTSFYRQIATDLANFRQKEEADFAVWAEDQKESNRDTLAVLIEDVRNASDNSKAEILNLLQQLNDLVGDDAVGQLILQINDKLSKNGGTMNGSIDMDANPLTGLPDPMNDTDAATKKYTDTKAVTDVRKGTLLASKWSAAAPFTQEITVDGVLFDDYPFVDIDLSEVTDAVGVIENWTLVGRCTVSKDNTITAYCYEEKPTVDIPVIFKVVR